MKTYDYKLIDDSTIRAIYLKILNKHSGEQYVTIAHSTFSHKINELIMMDLKTSLTLTDSQAIWLLNAHTIQVNSLKRGLLDLDEHVSDIDYYDYLGWAFKIKKEAKLGYFILGSITILVVFLLIMMSVRLIADDFEMALFVLIPIGILALTGCGLVYLYYRIAYQIKPNLKDMISDDTIEMKKIKLLEYLTYLPRRGHAGYVSVFALKIYYVENKQTKTLIYPLLERQNILTDHPYRIFNKPYRKVIQNLNNIRHLKVSYQPSTRLIVACDQDLSRLIFSK